jgi:hypothetical protein
MFIFVSLNAFFCLLEAARTAKRCTPLDLKVCNLLHAGVKQLHSMAKKGIQVII